MIFLTSGLPNFIAASKIYPTIIELNNQLPANRYDGRFAFVFNAAEQEFEIYLSDGTDWNIAIGAGGLESYNTIEDLEFDRPAAENEDEYALVFNTPLNEFQLYKSDGVEWSPVAGTIPMEPLDQNAYAGEDVPSVNKIEIDAAKTQSRDLDNYDFGNEPALVLGNGMVEA